MLTPLLAPTVRNMLKRRKKSGCVRKCEVGAQSARHWPFWHSFAPFWQEIGNFSKLAQILPHLHDD